MFNKIVIIGCGLIGSSIAGAVRQKKLAREIVGIEVHNIEDVKKLSFFDSVKKSILEVNQADFVIISTPVASLANVFFDLADRHYVKKFGLVTDVLSTKKSLLNSINYLDTKKKRFFLSSFPLKSSSRWL
jgi:prephenate dehydrogenase